MSEPQDIRESLSAYLDGELEADEAQRVDAAARRDAALAQQLDALRATRELLRRLPPVRTPADFAAGVLAEVRRRDLLPAPAEQARGAALWPGRLSAAAVLLLAACVGGIVLATVWHGGASSGERAAEPALVLARAARKLEEDGGPSAGIRERGRAEDRSARMKDRANRLAAPRDATPLGKEYADGQDAGRKQGPADALVARLSRQEPAARPPSLALASVEAKLAEGLKGVVDARDGLTVEEVKLSVTDLAAARREVEAILVRAALPPLGAPESQPAAYAQAKPKGPIAGTAIAPAVPGPGVARGGERQAFYQEVWRGPGGFQHVVVDSAEGVSRLVAALRGLQAARKDADFRQRLCLDAGSLAEATRPAPPLVAKRRPSAAGREPPSRPYHVADIHRLSGQDKPLAEAKPTLRPGPAPAKQTRHVLVITVALRPQAATTSPNAAVELNVKQ